MKDIGISLAFTLAILLLFSVNLNAESNGLMFWNTLGSDEEVLNSEVGANLEFYNPSVHGGTGCCDAVGNRIYVEGPFENFENGVQLSGSYDVTARIHNIVLSNLTNYISSERGTIEVWYMQTEDPVPYSHNIYRIFDGSFGLNSGMGLQSSDNNDGTGKDLTFYLYFGGTNTYVTSDISAYNGEWIHIAAVWDRAGIDGTSDAMRLYVNESQAAATTQNTWGISVGSLADICGANDAAGYFSMDNLIIWNYAKTDFDSSNPSPIPYYSCVGFEPPMDNGPVTVKGKNRALPFKAELEEDSTPITDTDIVAAPVIQVLFDSGGGGDPIDVTDQALSAGQGTEGNEFVFTDDGKWQFNLKTKNYTAVGTYTLNIVSGDDAEYRIDPTCEAQFVVE